MDDELQALIEQEASNINLPEVPVEELPGLLEVFSHHALVCNQFDNYFYFYFQRRRKRRKKKNQNNRNRFWLLLNFPKSIKVIFFSNFYSYECSIYIFYY